MSTQTLDLIIGVNDYSWLDRSLSRAQGTSDLQGALSDVHCRCAKTIQCTVSFQHVQTRLTYPRHSEAEA
mgnify:CR=1 FL=1